MPTRVLPSRDEVLAVLDDERDYARAGRALGVPPGLAYLAATGMPADGGDALAPEDRHRAGLLTGSTQHLANPVADRASRPDTVHEWIRRRARGDGPMQEAAAARGADQDTGRPRRKNDQ